MEHWQLCDQMENDIDFCFEIKVLSTFMLTRGIGPHKIWKVLRMTVRSLLAIVSHFYSFVEQKSL